MSTSASSWSTTSLPFAALLRLLVDDAAVFPPGSSPLPVAVADHREHRAARYAGFVGPLLVRAGDAATTAALLHAREGLGIALVVRPGADPVVLPTAVDQLQREGRALVRGLELPVSDPISLRPATELAVPVWLEVTQSRLGHDLDAVAAVGANAKLRTGGLTAADVPPSAVLADFIVECVSRALRFKLTAGLHHAVRAVEPASGLDQHGIANVLAATAAAVSGGTPGEVRDVLDERDPEQVRAGLLGLGEDDVDRLRARFVSFGCCGVTDPLYELADLLHQELHDPTDPTDQHDPNDPTDENDPTAWS
ncbi:hypothetical protein ACPPVT_06140 [Angustibacter sp. McL0619]|uniref:hypothetical protein n=1 Tax=Angustibacter sp. McL0619 TaxID=3415676 RepID=UPI003CF320B4